MISSPLALQAQTQQCSNPYKSEYCFADLPIEVGDVFYWDILTANNLDARMKPFDNDSGPFVDELQFQVTINESLAYQTLTSSFQTDLYLVDLTNIEDYVSDDFNLPMRGIFDHFYQRPVLIAPTFFQRVLAEIPENGFDRLLTLDESDRIRPDRLFLEDNSTIERFNDEIRIYFEDIGVNSANRTMYTIFHYHTGFLVYYKSTWVQNEYPWGPINSSVEIAISPDEFSNGELFGDSAQIPSILQTNPIWTSYSINTSPDPSKQPSTKSILYGSSITILVITLSIRRFIVKYSSDQKYMV